MENEGVWKIPNVENEECDNFEVWKMGSGK